MATFMRLIFSGALFFDFMIFAHATGIHCALIGMRAEPVAQEKP